MSDDPTPHARIYLTPPCCGNYEHGEVTWCEDAANECGNCGAPPTAYVPAARLDAAERERDALREALKAIVEWKTPRVQDPDDPDASISYSYAYGSNGERDYFRAVARAALTANHSATVVEG